MNSIQGIGSNSAMMGLMGMQRPAQLSEEAQEKIKDILSNYDPENVTAADAKSIFEQFRSAGIRPGPGMRETIEAAGFDAEALREMGMPEDMRGGGPPPGMSGTQGVNQAALSSLKTILSQYDLTNLNSNDQQSILEQLQQSGLLVNGSLINIGV